jgi:glutamyl-tRNA reductase
MRLLLVGLSHHTAPIELREQVAFSSSALPDALAVLGARLPGTESVILSTCNRTEIYATGDDPNRTHEALFDFLAGFHRLEATALREYTYARPDADAVRHLFRVAAGLDSLVVGEPQILGQVKDAYAVASERRNTGATLNKLFHWSFGVGKRVRAETGLGEGAVSVGYAAVSLARKIFGDLKGLHVLVLGAGEMATLTAQHLRAQEVGRVAVASRTNAHADALVAAIGATSIAWDDLDAALATADIVLTATGATKPVLTRPRVGAALRSRRSRPLFIIDIAVPRDVDPAVGNMDQVFLYNVDDLQAVVSDNVARRASQISRADGIISEEVAKFVAWLHAREAVPTLVALRQRFEAIRQAELKRLEPKLGQLGPEALARVDEVTRLIVEKLLIGPTEQLKTLSDRELVVAHADALNRLFGLADPESTDQTDREQGTEIPASFTKS